jgi:hypothetical protein
MMANEKKKDEISKDLKDQLEKEAFERVCKAVGTTPAEIEAREAQKKKNDEMVEYDIRPQVVHINGQPYSHGVEKQVVVETILHMAGSRRNRLMEESLGKNHELIGATLQSRLVSVQDASGLEVSK